MAPANGPPWAVLLLGFSGLLAILWFVAWFTRDLVTRGYSLRSALVAAGAVGLIAAEVAYRLLGWALIPYGFGGPWPSLIA